MRVSVDFSDVGEHLDFLFTGARGYVVIGLLNRESKHMTEQAFRWPQQRDDLITAINRVKTRDVFICPYPMESDQRAKGNTTALRMLHTDMDYRVPRHVLRDLKRFGFRLVASGTPGHIQAFARLKRSVTPAEHRALEIGLRDWGARWGKTEKIADNDFMRVPGKTNHKNGNDVEVLSHGRWAVDPDKLMDVLGARPSGQASVDTTRADVQVVPIPDDLWTDVEALLTERAMKGTRSERAYNAVMMCAECGYSRDEIHAILADYDPGVDKYGLRWASQIDDILVKSGTRALELYSPDLNFWDQRKKLRHIREYAYATDANPWATLGAVLVNILHQVPTNVYIPGRNGTEVGTRALNMYVALVGRSGAGKKTATDAAKHAIDVGVMHPSMGIGSGEGISKAYRRAVVKGDDAKTVNIYKGQVIKTTKVTFDVAEVSTWNSLATRQGATLTPELLKGFSGEALGFSNADDTKTNHVPANEYRMCVIIGAQPLMCGPLLANAASGLPQRFLWLPAKESRKYGFDDRPTPPSTLVWEMPDVPLDGCTIDFPRTVLKSLFEYGRECQDSKDPLNSQAPVIKARLTAAFALLEGRLHVTDEDWELAGMVMRVSERCRDAVMKQLAQQSRTENMRRGASRGVQRAEEERVVEREKTRAAMGAVMRYVETHGGWVSGLRAKLNSRHRDYVSIALNELVDQKKLETRMVARRGVPEGVAQYRLPVDK